MRGSEVEGGDRCRSSRLTVIVGGLGSLLVHLRLTIRTESIRRRMIVPVTVCIITLPPADPVVAAAAAAAEVREWGIQQVHANLYMPCSQWFS